MIKITFCDKKFFFSPLLVFEKKEQSFEVFSHRDKIVMNFKLHGKKRWKFLFAERPPDEFLLREWP